jgi:hypothetical protein
MRKGSLLFVSMIAMSVVGCGGRDDRRAEEDRRSAAPRSDTSAEADRPPEAPPASIEGDWSSTEPIVSRDGGLTITLTDAQQTYFADNKVTFSGRMTFSGRINGAAVPPGVTARFSGDGSWSKEGNVLRESIENVSLIPDSRNREIVAGAARLEAALESQPSSISDILELTPNRLRLRGRTSGTLLTLTR